MSLGQTRRPSRIVFNIIYFLCTAWFIFFLKYFILENLNSTYNQSQLRQFRVIADKETFVKDKANFIKARNVAPRNEFDFDVYSDERFENIGLSLEDNAYRLDRSKAQRVEYVAKKSPPSETDTSQHQIHTVKKRMLPDYESKRVNTSEYDEKLSQNHKHVRKEILLKSLLDKLVPPSPEISPGEFGKAVNVDVKDLPEEIVKKVQLGYNKHGFNQYVSSVISLRRRKPDFRSKECESITYPRVLPQTTVIICFHNEAVSTLLRTVFSVLDNTSPRLLYEIVLVDDFSTDKYLQEEITSMVSKLPRVRMVKASRRLGLVGARLLGAATVKSPVITFLDSHVECMNGWLEPMLARIQESPNSVPFPVIHGINKDDFSFYEVASESSGLFNWVDLSFYPTLPPPQVMKDRRSHTDPVPVPIMPGGIFSIRVSYFRHLGSYDPGLQLWGSENVELSVKTWMCNGSVELIPCSQVGHVYRNNNPNVANNDTKILLTNAMRVAYVWMDDYRTLLFNNIVNGARVPEFGDVRDRIKLRQKLACKPFDWFLDTVAPDLYSPLSATPASRIQNGYHKNMCLSHGAFSLELFLAPCDKTHVSRLLWYLDGEILMAGILGQRTAWGCLSATSKTLSLTAQCDKGDKTIKWRRTKMDSISSLFSELCIDVSQDYKLKLSRCSETTSQTWTFSNPLYNLDDIYS